MPQKYPGSDQSSTGAAGLKAEAHPLILPCTKFKSHFPLLVCTGKLMIFPLHALVLFDALLTVSVQHVQCFGVSGVCFMGKF